MLPQHTRTYQHHHLDSTRWERFIPRDNDIIISTPYKSGTTWMQEIVVQLIFLDRDVPSSQDVSPWLDARFQPIDALLSQLEHQEHRRCIKSHLALDGLPYFPSSRYVVVGRDPRDVFTFVIVVFPAIAAWPRTGIESEAQNAAPRQSMETRAGAQVRAR